MISKKILNKLNRLSEKELLKVFEIMDMGLLNEIKDKEELILILSSEPENKIKKALKNC